MKRLLKVTTAALALSITAAAAQAEGKWLWTRMTQMRHFLPTSKQAPWEHMM